MSSYPTRTAPILCAVVLAAAAGGAYAGDTARTPVAPPPTDSLADTSSAVTVITTFFPSGKSPTPDTATTNVAVGPQSTSRPAVPCAGDSVVCALTRRLRALEAIAPPDTVHPPSTKYHSHLPPDRATYVCPVCGATTVYRTSYPIAREITVDMPAGRQFTASASGLKATLDEHQFCRRCTPGVGSPQLGLEISYGDSTLVHRVLDVRAEDFQLLREFLAGSVVHTLDDGTKVPLSGYARRLQELLGISDQANSASN